MRLPCLSLFFVLPAFLFAQTPSAVSPEWFPFTVSAFDDGPAALDLSSLNEMPAGRHGFIRASGEILTDDRGQPWRYFGTNLTAGACFPSAEDAPKLAGHLAKCGFNLVRLHFMDENWTSLQLVRKDGQPGLNPEALARLDRFSFELKKCGIFLNLNLHVGRKYPDQPDGAPDNSKGIDNIYPPYVEALKQFARDLLLHVNPHTGLTYAADPAVAIVEVNNENTLLMNSFWPARISGPVHESIREQWKKWAAKTYQNDDAKLRAAWGTRRDGDGENLISNGTFAKNAEGWTLSQEGGSVASLAPAAEGKGIRLTVTKPGTVNWHTQLTIGGVNLTEGKRYRLRFRARAEAACKIYTCTQQSHDPYEVLGLWTEVGLEAGWKDYRFDFTAKRCEPGKANLHFGPNGNKGWFEFSDVYLDEVSEGFLPADANLASGLPLPDETANVKVLRDYYQFLAEVELQYAKEMHRFLKEEIKVKCLVTHSHIFFGALLGVRREALVSDVVHANAYWHHPSFPVRGWDPVEWEIQQQILSQAADGGILAELAVQRHAGKPFALTEWDIPSPMDSLAEGLPLLAAFASYQEWSGITLYTFAHDTSDLQAEHYSNFFNYQGHPAKRAGIPFAALMFRNGAVSPGQERATLSVSTTALFTDIAANRGNIWANWRRFYQTAGWDASQALKRQTEIVINETGDAGPVIKNPAPQDSPAVTDNGQITWGSGDNIARVISDHVLFASGSLGGKALTLGGCELTTGALPGDGFAVWGLIALDGKPVKESGKLLGLALRRTENEGMVWRADRRSVGNQWGKGPSLVLGYQASVTLPGDASWTISALGPDGKVTSVLTRDSRTWSISPQDRTVWWLLEKN